MEGGVHHAGPCDAGHPSEGGGRPCRLKWRSDIAVHFNRMTRAAMWTSDCESGKTEKWRRVRIVYCHKTKSPLNWRTLKQALIFPIP